MTHEKFLVALYALARRCSYDLDDWEVAVYETELAPSGWDKVLEALRKLYLTVKGGQKWGMPSVADIKAAMGETEVDARLAASDAAARCIGAVSVYKSLASKIPAAQAYIGEVGWAAIRQSFGGWIQFCDTLTYENEMALRAQLRDVCQAMIEKVKRGIPIEAPIALPESQSAGQKLVASAVSAALTSIEPKSTRKVDLRAAIPRRENEQ